MINVEENFWKKISDRTETVSQSYTEIFNILNLWRLKKIGVKLDSCVIISINHLCKKVSWMQTYKYDIFNNVYNFTKFKYFLRSLKTLKKEIKKKREGMTKLHFIILKNKY